MRDMYYQLFPRFPTVRDSQGFQQKQEKMNIACTGEHLPEILVKKSWALRRGVTELNSLQTLTEKSQNSRKRNVQLSFFYFLGFKSGIHTSHTEVFEVPSILQYLKCTAQAAFNKSQLHQRNTQKQIPVHAKTFSFFQRKMTKEKFLFSRY